MRTLKTPFQIDARGGLAYTISTQDVVEQQIIDILVTSKFERPMNPNYGADLLDFIFSPVRTQLLSVKADEIRALLNATLSLATIVSLNLSSVPGSDSSLSLDIRYTISPSPTLISLTRTISGLISEETTFGEVV